MIDVEDLILSRVQDALAAKEDMPQIAFSKVYQRKPAKFPHVFMCETDNAADRRTRDSGGVRYANLTYEVNIYSNKLNGKKQECRKIANAIDEAMQEMNMTRISLRPIDNLADDTIYRIVGRYEVTADESGKLYARR